MKRTLAFLVSTLLVIACISINVSVAASEKDSGSFNIAPPPIR